jgi:hypothetical protein
MIPSHNGSFDVILEYEGSLPDLETAMSAINDIWSEALKTDPKTWSRIGMSPADVPLLPPFRLKITQGADPASVTLLVMSASAGIGISKTVILDVWKQVLLPKLKRRFGATFRERPRKR